MLRFLNKLRACWVLRVSLAIHAQRWHVSASSGPDPSDGSVRILPAYQLTSLQRWQLAKLTVILRLVFV